MLIDELADNLATTETLDPAASGAFTDIGELDAPVRFRRQPRPLPADQRVAYRLALLVLVLGNFNKAAASIENLNLLFWAIKASRSRNLLLSWWNGRRLADTVTERIDPGLPVTLSLGVAHGLVQIVGATKRRAAMTEDGLSLFATLTSNDELMRVEKAFLARLIPLSDNAIRRTLGR